MSSLQRALRFLGITEDPNENRLAPAWVYTTLAVLCAVCCIAVLSFGSIGVGVLLAVLAVVMIGFRRRARDATRP